MAARTSAQPKMSPGPRVPAVPPPCGGNVAAQASVQRQVATSSGPRVPTVPAPCGGNVAAHASVQPKMASGPDRPAVPAPCGGNVSGAGRASQSVQPKMAAGSVIQRGGSSSKPAGSSAPPKKAVVAKPEAPALNFEQYAAEQEQLRLAQQQREQAQARAAALAAKPLLPKLTIGEDDLGNDKDNKRMVNMKCAELAASYPDDVEAYDETLVTAAVTKAESYLRTTYGYQLSGNKDGAILKLNELVGTARRKRYPLENEAFVKSLVEIAIALYFLGVSGSDDADRSAHVTLRR